MSNDIVTLCRELQADEKQLGNDLLAQCLWDSADEIERLRAEVDSKDAQAYLHLRRLYDERGEDIAKLEDEIRELGSALTSMSKSRDRAMRALQEAVRGD